MAKQLGLLRGDLLLQLLSLRSDFRCWNVHRRFIAIVQESGELVVVLLRSRVVLVIVTLAAIEREAKPNGAGGGHAIVESVPAEFERVGSAFLVQHGVTVKAGRDSLVERRPFQQIARELLDRELVERHVIVDGLDDPIAIEPHRAGSIFLVAVGVGIASQVEPFARPAFTVML